MLKPIRHRKISDQIFEQLRDMIYRGEFQPGQRLMSERELAERFAVGRPTVREAVLKLVDQGLIQSRRGVGTFVADEKTQNVSGPLLQVLTREGFLCRRIAGGTHGVGVEKRRTGRQESHR